MNQLTTLDAGFLKVEDADPHASLAIGALVVIEGPAPDHDLFISTLAQRLRACPRFGQRLRLRPFDLGAPEWVDDPDFDVARQVVRIAAPQPGDDRELFGLVADVMARRLDRDRPLWEIWVVEGLSDNRWAMLTKVHHCMADGIAVTHMLVGLCDTGISGSPVSNIRDIRAPKEPKSHGSPHGLFALNPLSVLSGLWNASATVTAAAARTAVGAAEIAAGLLRPATSALNGPISTRRRYSGARVALGDIEQVCRTFNVTVNDVALAAITESYRNVFVRRGEQPMPDSLRTLVPVSTRTAESFGKTDNRVSLMLPYLPVEEANAVERLRLVHSRMGRTKSHGQRHAGGAFVSLANRIPYPLSAWAVRLLTGLPQRGVVTLATNVPGPREELRIMGRKVVSVFPVPPIAMQLRSGVAMLSYAQDLFFGILSDYDAVVDVDELAKGIEVAVERLVASSKRRKSPRDRRGLSLVV